MTTFFGKNSNGIFGFYDSTIMEIPSDAVAISEDKYSALLKAEYAGAVLSIESDSVVARDYSGTLINLASVTSSSNYRAPVPFATQAASALATARTYVNNNYTMLNEPTPDAWVTYLKALMAIANGTDTTSTTLPTAPTS